jgi:queuine/archaeosine tRNA-ribosyltransferase
MKDMRTAIEEKRMETFAANFLVEQARDDVEAVA